MGEVEKRVGRRKRWDTPHPEMSSTLKKHNHRMVQSLVEVRVLLIVSSGWERFGFRYLSARPAGLWALRIISSVS